MKANFEKHLSETAFLTNESRARMVELSQDTYAYLWVTPKTKKIWEDFSKAVYPYDDLELSIRNRYFLERLKKFVSSHEKPLFVNVGAGFTSYPFLIDATFQTIEIDLRHVIEFKASKIQQWQKEGVLPKKEVELFPYDLRNMQELDRLGKQLPSWIRGKPSFILLEGISYYLEMPFLLRLLEMFKNNQQQGSQIGLEYWKPEIKNHPVFLRLQEYFKVNFGYENREYNLFGLEFIKTIPGYRIAEITDTAEQEKIYSRTSIIKNYEQILPTDFSILERI